MATSVSFVLLFVISVCVCMKGGEFKGDSKRYNSYKICPRNRASLDSVQASMWY